jgi:hypothetical protein
MEEDGKKISKLKHVTLGTKANFACQKSFGQKERCCRLSEVSAICCSTEEKSLNRFLTTLQYALLVSR